MEKEEKEMRDSSENWVTTEMENIQTQQNTKYKRVHNRGMYNKAQANAAEETEKLIVR